jgi:hypothetical protein
MFFITFFDLNCNLVAEYLATRKVGKEGRSGKELFETLKEVLVDNKLLLHFLASLTTDGASACRGRAEGAVKYMVGLVSFLITVHCFCHQFAFFFAFSLFFLLFQASLGCVSLFTKVD